MLEDRPLGRFKRRLKENSNVEAMLLKDGDDLVDGTRMNYEFDLFPIKVKAPCPASLRCCNGVHVGEKQPPIWSKDASALACEFL
jgi:hypothetical protein